MSTTTAGQHHHHHHHQYHPHRYHQHQPSPSTSTPPPPSPPLHVSRPSPSSTSPPRSSSPLPPQPFHPASVARSSRHLDFPRPPSPAAAPPTSSRRSSKPSLDSNQYILPLYQSSPSPSRPSKRQSHDTSRRPSQHSHDATLHDSPLSPQSPRSSGQLHHWRDQEKHTSLTPPNAHEDDSPAYVVSTTSDSDDEDDDGGSLAHKSPSSAHILRALVHLSFVAAPLSFAFSIYTVVVLFWVLITAPLRLCFSARPTVNQRISTFLNPPLLFQLRRVLPPPPPPRSSTSSRKSPSSSRHGSASMQPPAPLEIDTLTKEASSSNKSRLVIVHLLSSVLSLPFTVGAWIAACAWGMSALVADETAGGDNEDERRVARKFVGMWIRWLEWGTDAAEHDKQWDLWYGHGR